MRALCRWATVLGAGLAVLILSMVAQAVTKPRAATKPRVLILGTSVHGGNSSWEAKKARAGGFAVTLVSARQWDKMTAAQFKHYRALVIGDDQNWTKNTSPIKPAVKNRFVWGHAINGNIILAGSDPEDHATFSTTNAAGAQLYIAKAIAFAAKRPGHTGFYFAGNYYRNCGGMTCTSPQHVRVLDGLAHKRFYWQVEDKDTIHIDPATRPKVPGPTDTTMSGWSNTAHEAFTTWSKKSFHVWAVGVDPAGNWTTSDHVVGWAQWLVSTR